MASLQKTLNKTVFHPLIAQILEYYLVFFVIIECNTMFTYSINNGSGHVAQYLRLFAVLLSGYLFVYYLLMCRAKGVLFRKYLPAALGLAAYAFVFYLLNVRRLSGASSQKEYILLFLWFLPVMASIFWMQRELGYGPRFFYEHANLVVIFAGISLFFYVILTINPDLLYSDVLRSKWYGNAYTGIWCNFYNFVTIRPDFFRTLVGVPLYLNYGFFSEPLMFCIALHTALYTEMFLRDPRQQHIWKWILLSLTIITTQSSLGFMLLALAWGLKVMQTLYQRGKKRWIAVCLLALAAAVAGLLFQKFRMVGNSNGFVLGQHMEDYYLGFKAFLAKPLLGCGYSTNSFIRSFMSESRLKADPGFSNSLAMIPAQGGILLSILCFLPALLCLLQCRKGKDHSVFFWMIGPYGMFALTIFHYRMFMLVLFAFGYSLLRMQDTAKAAGETAEEAEDVRQQGQQQRKKRDWKTAVILCVIAVVCLLTVGIWAAPMQRFFYRYQLYFGQSVWKFACAIMAVIGWILLTVYRLRTGRLSSVREKLTQAVFFFAFHFLLLFLLTGCYTKVNTWLYTGWVWRDVVESFLIFAWAVVLLLLLGRLYDRIVSMLNRKSGSAVMLTKESKEKGGRTASQSPASIAVWLAGTAGFAAVCLIFCAAERKAANNAASSLSSEQALLETAAEAARESGGRLYANEAVDLFRQPGQVAAVLTNTTTRGNGFASYNDASIVFAHDEEVQELFDSNYQVTELSDQYLLYSNDEQVITALGEKGQQWYRYYAYEEEIDLNGLAKQNKLSMTNTGEVIVDSDHKLLKGPDIQMEAGDYTVSFIISTNMLMRLSEEVVCQIQVGYNKGNVILTARDITFNEFETNKELRIDLPVTIPDVNDLRFIVLCDEEGAIQINHIVVKRSPEFATICTYNSLRRVTKEAYFTKSGETFSKSEGYAVKEVTYNRIGQILQTDYLDAEDQLTMITGGYARNRCVYDRLGRKILDSYYDNRDFPAVLSSGVSSYAYEYDENGNVSEYRYLGQDGKLTMINSGYAILDRLYNDKHQIVREWYLDTDEAPCISASGYASVEYEYDENGNIIDHRYYDQDKNPIMLLSGYAELRRKYNEDHRIVQEAYYDTEGKLYPISGGYAIVEYAYDPIGNRIEYKYYDTTYQPVINASGYAVLHRKYNEKRQMICDVYGNENDQCIVIPSGQASTKYEYDDLGNIVLYSYYDQDGNITVMPDGYSMIRRDYNDLRQLIRSKYLDQTGAPMQLENGVAFEEYKYDDRGNIIEWSYYDLSGRPVRKNGIYSQYHRSYNGMNQIKEEWYSNTDGSLLNVNWGYAKVKHLYDETGKEKGIIYYDENEEVIEPTTN